MTEADSAEQLVARVAEGDPAAEEELYFRYRKGVTIILNRASAGLPVAADLAQETFSIVFEKIRRHQVREPAKIASFIWSTARFVAIEFFRKQRSRPDTIEVEEVGQIADDAPGPLDQVLSDETRVIARYVLGRLGSKRDREILYRFYVAEEEKESICADLGLSSLQFNLVLFRARKQYKKLYCSFAEKHGRHGMDGVK